MRLMVFLCFVSFSLIWGRETTNNVVKNANPYYKEKFAIQRDDVIVLLTSYAYYRQALWQQNYYQSLSKVTGVYLSYKVIIALIEYFLSNKALFPKNMRVLNLALLSRQGDRPTSKTSQGLLLSKRGVYLISYEVSLANNSANTIRLLKPLINNNKFLLCRATIDGTEIEGSGIIGKSDEGSITAKLNLGASFKVDYSANSEINFECTEKIETQEYSFPLAIDLIFLTAVRLGMD